MYSRTREWWKWTSPERSGFSTIPDRRVDLPDTHYRERRVILKNVQTYDQALVLLVPLALEVVLFVRRSSYSSLSGERLPCRFSVMSVTVDITCVVLGDLIVTSETSR